MNVPPKTNPQWANLVTGKKVFTLKFLAAKILLGRLTRSVADDSSPKNVNDCVSELHALFEKNSKAPSAQEDLKTIFG
jgi:Na+-transporting NADH:ubiquinone oxidoreductase subunit NqrC